MSHAITYTNVPGLDLTVERKKIDFPVNRETQLSETYQFVSGFNQIVIPDPNNIGKILPIGEVPATRPFFPYAETMDWILKEFNEIGIPFKLRASVIDRKNFNLYQEYIFDQEVTSPDGEGISPMVVVHSSYVKGSPLSLYLGTYRFVCSNGAIVSVGGKTHISVNTRNWDGLLDRGFHDEFRDAFDHYADVSVFYARLSDIPLAGNTEAIFGSKLIPFCMRKKIIGQLEEDGLVVINIASDKPDGEKYKALKEEELSNPSILSVNGNVSTWDVYNRFTNLGSKLKSSNRVLIAGKSINQVFRRLEQIA